MATAGRLVVDVRLFDLDVHRGFGLAHTLIGMRT
jgi:hypothetical protein